MADNDAHDINALRAHLFATLEALRDENNPMELDRAKAIAEVAQVVINSARAEIEFARATEREVSSRFLLPAGTAPQPDKPAAAAHPGYLGSRIHRIQG